MKRYCLTLDLVDDPVLIAEYERMHDEIWPEIVEAIHAAGISRMEIYRLGTRLCMVMETVDSFSFEAKAAADARNEAVQRWEELMWKYQRAVPGSKAGEKWRIMERLFVTEQAAH